MEKELICKKKDIPETITRKEFITKFFKIEPNTYYKNNILQCEGGKNRSFTDLLNITKSRFPKTSLETIIRIVGELNLKKFCNIVWCTQVEKFVIMSNPSKPANFITDYTKKYYSEKIGQDGISFKQLVEIREKYN